MLLLSAVFAPRENTAARLGARRALAWLFGFALLAFLSSLILSVFFENDTRTPPQGAAELFLVCVLTPLAEEAFFRRTLSALASSAAGTFAGALISSLAFAFFHLPAESAIYAFIMGLFLSFAYRGTGSFFLIFLCHALNNSAAALGI
jgi:membrane protease YdiL (CAAX protease family)